ncbi:hypothetical protein P691DRAFT_842811 [Macrolepiota fuliginosa MF-IS2]|uniref:F-box domain-containing protein n=1 Tax=Macrolepiota fuliginosa MF-IS2 TaxID=1400762 RepID=A0A9P6BZG6_9AGAR|nr:hypothetical protein P691DRAFT_842811 [Macrolepiota fuliginosa MF-IS2]
MLAGWCLLLGDLTVLLFDLTAWGPGHSQPSPPPPNPSRTGLTDEKLFGSLLTQAPFLSHSMKSSAPMQTQIILHSIPPEILSKTLLFLAMMESDTRYGAMWHSNLLSLSELEFKTICSRLSAVVHFCDQTGPIPHTVTGHPFHYTNTEAPLVESSVTHLLGGSISFYHKSFCDFLGDPMRSSTFCIASQTVHNALFKHCLELHIKYQESYCLDGTHLTLMPGFPDSASSLSYPHTNEHVNSIIKAKALDVLHNYCLLLALFPNTNSQLPWLFQHVDFHKQLQIRISMFLKVVGGVQLFWLLSHDFLSLFNDGTGVQFKEHPLKLVEQIQKAGIVQPYHNGFSSQLKSFLHHKSQGQPVTGLYRMGNGLKSTFWYWEIDFKLGHFQGFHAVNLDEGERVY